MTGTEQLERRRPGRMAAAFWITGAIVPIGVAFVLYGNQGLVQPDETLPVQIARRILSGEILYRDIAFVTTPLSAYLTLPAIALLGGEVLVIRALQVLLFAASLLLALRILRLASQPAAAPAFVLACCVYAGPMSLVPLFDALASVFLLACLLAVLRWQNGGSRRALLASGFCAGLCFGAQHGAGASVLAALVLVVFYCGWGADRRRLPRSLVEIAISFAIAAFLALFPVILTGGSADFISWVITSKAVRLPTLAPLLQSKSVYWQAALVLPPLALLSLLLLSLRGEPARRCSAFTLLVFCAAGLLGLYPLMSLVLIGIVCAWRALAHPPRFRRVAELGTFVWLVVGFVYLVTGPWVRLASGAVQISSLPHLRGTLMASAHYAEVRDFTRRLAGGVAPGARVFLLTPDASIYYLTAGLRNPTPHDDVTTAGFRPGDEEELERAAARGEIGAVCVDNVDFKAPFFARMRPARFEQYVREHFRPGPQAGFCSLYIAPATSSGP